MKVALVVGHTAKAPGAVNGEYALSEFAFNLPLVEKLKARLGRTKNEAVLILRDEPDDYKGLPAKINAAKPDFIVSFHANAGPEGSEGSEVLYFTGSKAGQRLASVMLERIVRALGTKNRGIKPRTYSERGGYLLAKTEAPCVIVEPFFLSNNEETRRAVTSEGMAALLAAYEDGILRYVGENCGC